MWALEKCNWGKLEGGEVLERRDLDTHLVEKTDLVGRRESMSMTVSFGRSGRVLD